MRTLLLTLAVSLCLVGCTESQRERNEKGQLKFAIGEKMPTSALKFWTPTYIEIDGHEYLAIDYDRGLGLTHSPKCSCLKEGTY